MPVRSGWLSPDGQTREDTRLIALGALTPTSSVATRSGILPGSADGLSRISGFTLTGTTGTMSATISPGRAVVQTTDARGAYPVALTEYLPLTFTDGHPQYSRIDLVVLRIYDDPYDSSGRTDAAVEIVTGNASPTPVAPPTPASSLPLHEVLVPAGASAGASAIVWTSAVTGRRTATVGVGGILPVTTDSANGAYPGQFRDSSGVLQRWSGSAWADYQPPVAVETTTTGATVTGSWTLGSYNARRTRGVCSFTLALTRTTSALASNTVGNITDETVATLPSGWRPATETMVIASDSVGDGAARIQTDGTVQLLTWSTNGSIAIGANLRLSACYVL